MMTCLNCGHINPDSATQCEACFAPIPELSNCSHCGASVAVDALFCAQCGMSLQVKPATPAVGLAVDPLAPTNMGPAAEQEQLLSAAAMGAMETEVAANFMAVPPTEVNQSAAFVGELGNAMDTDGGPDLEIPVAEGAAPSVAEKDLEVPSLAVESDLPVLTNADSVMPSTPVGTTPMGSLQGGTGSGHSSLQSLGQTQIQQRPHVQLIHVRSEVVLDIPMHLDLVHIGKPNDRVPPDVDVSGFADSDVVSRIHADLRCEGDSYYIEDRGSSNGTYVNNQPLRAGDRFRLRPGDRISLGKEDKVSFIFKMG